MKYKLSICDVETKLSASDETDCYEIIAELVVDSLPLVGDEFKDLLVGDACSDGPYKSTVYTVLEEPEFEARDKDYEYYGVVVQLTEKGELKEGFSEIKRK